MSRKRFGTRNRFTDDRISPDELFSLVEKVLGKTGAAFAVEVAETDDFGKFAGTMSLLGMPRCEHNRTLESGIAGYFAQPVLVNAILCMRYPFLFFSFRDVDLLPVEYFRRTWFDDIPVGWAGRFGLEICEDIRTVLERADESGSALERYRLDQIKEKYGTLRWYDGNIFNGDGHTYDDMHNLNGLYESLSGATCIECGDITDVWMTSGGWISPMCYKCMRASTRDEAINAFAHEHGFEKKWVPFDLASEISRYLTLSSCTQEDADLKELRYRVYSSEGEEEYSPYEQLHAVHPDLRIFQLGEQYALYGKSKGVATVEELDEMLAQENVK